MGIKAEVDREFFSSRQKQRDIALRFDEGFEVTYAALFSEMFFWLLSPKPHTKERFGFTNEVLVVYSPHPSTDARVLRVIDSIGRLQEFKHRIEKLVCIVIHHGDTAAAEMLKRHPDRIVVVFHAEELTGPSRGGVFIRGRIAESIGALDLFGMSSPIRSDKYFFGRDEIVHQLIGRATASGENTGLFGLRKTGKTSVLFGIDRRIADPEVLTVYVDCQNPGWHGGRWWEVLDRLSARCRTELSSRKKETPQAREYTHKTAGLAFAADVKDLFGLGIKQIVIQFDEVEYITHGLSGALGTHWDVDFVPFWQTIRSVHQETGGKFTFVVAGVNPACVEKSHFGVTPNPIFQLAQPHYLEPLTPSKVREMVKGIGRYAGMNFVSEVFDYLQETYGGHPYLIRIACSELWRNSDITNAERRTDVSVDSFRKLSDRIRARLEQPIKDILLSMVWWYPDEYDLLRILAGGDKSFVQQYLETETQSIVQFAKYGLLKPNSGEFAIADVRQFLRQHGEEYKNEISPFTRTDMPPDVLPMVPDLDVLGNLFKKRVELETKFRVAIMLYLGVRHAFDAVKISTAISKGLRKRPDRPDPSALFVGRTPQDVLNELYTSDLKDIVLGNWDVFGTLFDGHKGRFEMNMDSVNKARRAEAHTKPITSIEKEEFENSYAWLNTRLSKLPQFPR